MNSKAYIKAISYSLPPDELTNADICRLFPNTEEKDILKKTGIRKRHILKPGVISSDLAQEAAEKLFTEHRIDRNTIDYLIYCSEAFDYIGPATACVLQEKLKLSTSCGALDVGLGCTGFTGSLSLAKALVESGQATNILLLTADMPSTVIHPEDYDLRMIFGDAAAATLVSCSTDRSNIGKFDFGTDGSGAPNLIIGQSNLRHPIDITWLEKYKGVGGMPTGRMFMDPIAIFNFALKRVPPMVENIINKNNITKEQIDLFIFHQANGFLLSVLRRKLKIEEAKFFTYIENIGNTVSASIPIALYEAIAAGKAKKGDRILLASFGIGYSWSGTLITL